MSFGSNSDAIAAAVRRADARLDAAFTDVMLPDEARLDDRMRVALRTMLNGLVGGVEAETRRHAARLLAGRGRTDMAEAMLAGGETVLPILADTGLLRDPELMEEVIARTRGELIAEALPVAVGETNRPSLLVRLAEMPDTVVATAAQALLAADSRRGLACAVLPAEIQHRMVWWVAAAIRSSLPPNPDSDHALGEAARRCLAAHDEGGREAVADRLVVALDPLPGEIPGLLVEALGDRRLTLMVALLARALSIDADVVRSLVIEPDDDRLWVAMRAAGLSREQIAQVALSLSDADPRRDIEAFADRLDSFAAMTQAAAVAAVAPLSLPRELRLASRALARGRR